MNRMKFWMLAAILVVICGTVGVVTACNDAKAQDGEPAAGVKSTELIRTDKSWDGVELPDYFEGRPELVAVKYEFPAGIREMDSEYADDLNEKAFLDAVSK